MNKDLTLCARENNPCRDKAKCLRFTTEYDENSPTWFGYLFEEEKKFIDGKMRCPYFKKG